MVNAGSESSSKKSILHHLTQYTGLDFYQVLNLHGTINCKRVLPDYATSESGSDWVQIFVFPMICAWLPLFGFLPCTNAGWALQPGLTQSLRICKEGRQPPTPPPGYQSALKSHCFPEFPNSQHCHSHICQRKGLYPTDTEGLCCFHLGTEMEAISGSHLISITSEVFQNSFPKYLVASSQVSFFWSVWESSEWGPVVPLATTGTGGGREPWHNT